jgi:hypothetical protein
MMDDDNGIVSEKVENREKGEKGYDLFLERLDD